MIKRILENLAELLFPPTSLSGLGPVYLGDHIRREWGAGHERHVARFDFAVKIGPVVEGQAAPVYQRGTRASRMAQRGL